MVNTITQSFKPSELFLLHMIRDTMHSSFLQKSISCWNMPDFKHIRSLYLREANQQMAGEEVDHQPRVSQQGTILIMMPVNGWWWPSTGVGRKVGE
jgi:hypothetical protein